MHIYLKNGLRLKVEGSFIIGTDFDIKDIASVVIGDTYFLPKPEPVKEPEVAEDRAFYHLLESRDKLVKEVTKLQLEFFKYMKGTNLTSSDYEARGHGGAILQIIRQMLTNWRL